VRKSSHIGKTNLRMLQIVSDYRTRENAALL